MLIEGSDSLYKAHACVHYRQECSKLRQELRLQHEEDKKSAMSQLLQLKEREKTAARDSWQKKVEDLLNQVDYSLHPRTLVSLALSSPDKQTYCVSAHCVLFSIGQT